ELDETRVDQRQRTDDVQVTWRRDAGRPFAGAAEGRYQGAEATVAPAELLGRAAVRKTRPAKGYRLPALDQALRGSRTPLVYAVEGESLVLERLPGVQLKEALRADPQGAAALLEATGAAAARLHARGMTHGDLTTSNVLAAEGRVALVDFGLAALNAEDEDKGGDLHVLMEALEATHADLPDAFASVMKGYRAAGGTEAVARKVEEIVRRGRYRGT